MRRTELIADIGCNHMGDVRLAKAMVTALSEGGIKIVKFQAFDEHHLERLRQKLDKTTAESSNPLYEINQSNIFLDKVRQAMWDLNQFKAIAEFCELEGVEFLCTPYSVQWVRWLDPLVKRWKIRAADCRNKKLIEACVKTGKPIIMSISSYDESYTNNYWLRYAYREEYGARLFDPTFGGGFLYCVPRYPPNPTEMWLRCIQDHKFEGLSDHTPNLVAAIIAKAFGAQIIEKHVWYERMDVNCEVNPSEAVDKPCSISTEQFAQLDKALTLAHNYLRRT